MITAEKLRRFAPDAKNVEAQAAALEKARSASTVTTPRRLCAILGQLYVESDGFTVMEENLNYRNPERLDAMFKAVTSTADAQALIARGPQAIANRVYAGRLGNGDEASGDGWRYRGSGYMQLTGRGNYRAIGAMVKMDLENNPDLARDLAGAAQIAFAFWDANQCSPLADVNDFGGITARVNGPAQLALDERTTASKRAASIWPG